MWLPSFFAVVRDLWRFFIGLEHDALYIARSNQTSLVEPPVIAGTPVVDTSVVAMPPEQDTEPVSQAVELNEHIRYAKDHPATTSVRSYLEEQTTIKTAPADLTPYEWLAYRYTRSGRPLPWLALALAPLGYWHQALKGQQYVSVGVTPKTQSIMEWQDQAGNGQIGFVSTVAPDLSITLEQLGAELPGVLTKTVLDQVSWKELRPVFIHVS